MQNLGCKMADYKLKSKNYLSLIFFGLNGRKEIAKEFEEISSERESPNSAGSFGFKKTRRINPKTLPKNIKPI